MFELIPFEIHLNSTELSSEIKNIKVSLNQKVFCNYKSQQNKHFMTCDKKESISKNYNSFDKNEIKDSISLPKDSEFLERISIINIYLFFDNMKTIEINYNFDKNKNILPFCLGGLLNVEYYIIVDIEYKIYSSLII